MTNNVDVGMMIKKEIRKRLSLTAKMMNITEEELLENAIDKMVREINAEIFSELLCYYDDLLYVIGLSDEEYVEAYLNIKKEKENNE